MNCTECDGISKYKCPTCRAPYCSVICCKKHKEKPCSTPITESKDDKPITDPKDDYQFPTNDTVPQEKLKLLGESSEVKTCLENPHVREILKLLDDSPHPDRLLQEYMTEPIFTEFVDACLKVVQPPDDDHR